MVRAIVSLTGMSSRHGEQVVVVVGRLISFVSFSFSSIWYDKSKAKPKVTTISPTIHNAECSATWRGFYFGSQPPRLIAGSIFIGEMNHDATLRQSEWGQSWPRFWLLLHDTTILSTHKSKQMRSSTSELESIRS